MAPVNLGNVVSFSSQDEVHPVSNLLGGKKWLGSLQEKSGYIEAVFQLAEPCRIVFINIGTIWCTNVEVRVGKSDWPTELKYTTLVPVHQLMTSADCNLKRGTSRTSMFAKANFTEEGANGIWDRIQIICRQIWRKDVQLGISFLHINGANNVINTSRAAKSSERSTKRKLSDLCAIKKHFLEKISESNFEEDTPLKLRLQQLATSGDGCNDHSPAHSRIVRMVLAANQNKRKLVTSVQQKGNANSLYSDHVAKQQAPKLHEEVSKFLSDLKPEELDIDSVQISDLRHKFEQIKWRKLTKEEKCIFFTCCQDFLTTVFCDKLPDQDSDVGINDKPQPSDSNILLTESDVHSITSMRKQKKIHLDSSPASADIPLISLNAGSKVNLSVDKFILLDQDNVSGKNRSFTNSTFSISNVDVRPTRHNLHSCQPVTPKQPSTYRTLSTIKAQSTMFSRISKKTVLKKSDNSRPDPSLLTSGGVARKIRFPYETCSNVQGNQNLSALSTVACRLPTSYLGNKNKIKIPSAVRKNLKNFSSELFNSFKEFQTKRLSTLKRTASKRQSCKEKALPSKPECHVDFSEDRVSSCDDWLISKQVGVKHSLVQKQNWVYSGTCIGMKSSKQSRQRTRNTNQRGRNVNSKGRGAHRKGSKNGVSTLSDCSVPYQPSMIQSMPVPLVITDDC